MMTNSFFGNKATNLQYFYDKVPVGIQEYGRIESLFFYFPLSYMVCSQKLD
jgi:hypothetical protein